MQDGKVGELTWQGKAAAVALAKRLGLPHDEPVILSNRGNLLVQLTPAPVVARVATLTARSRRCPIEWLAREVAVAGYVASQGGPVVPPADDAGPHWQDGFAISLWEYVRAIDRVPSPADVGSALARLHRIARGCPAELGGLNAATDQITDGLAMLERDAVLDAGTLAALREAHTAALSEMHAAGGEVVVLHGDAHHRNLLLAPDDRWLWIDLEETGRGPAAWDLATMVSHYSEQEGHDALDAYAAESGTTVPALAPFRRVRDLEAAVWSACMAHLYPARYREVAHRLLASVLRG
ncbi:MAG TPA: aminoglycoside phosphotransferase family protein [Streptosporangiaceae bacterium]|jgi:aminoglycoside phosphotransferase